MTKVFVGGSRKLGRLNECVRARANKIVEEELFVLIGDANGADKAMQSYLAELGYRNVAVFHAGPKCRNNVGRWETRSIGPDSARKDRDFYTAKDVAMSEEADYGLMIWEGTSIGTMNNVLNLVQRGKKVVVYFSPENEFVTVRKLNDIGQLLDKCSQKDIDAFEKHLGLSSRLQQVQVDLNFAK